MNYTYQSLEDVETVRNRDDKSVLTIFSMHPERFLAKDVARPDEVKHLTIILGFSEIDVNHPTDTYYKWYRKDTNTLCSDIIQFHNLETLTAQDLNLSPDLWIQFANNSKSLREIHFSNCLRHYEDFDFNENVLDALFKVPSLETVYLYRIELPYFPPGPSNIKHLELDCVMAEEAAVDCFTNLPKNESEFQKIRKIYSQNFSTHTNIKSLIISKGSPTPFDLKDLKLDKLPHLEELTLKYWQVDEITTIPSLPNLKKITTC